MAQTIMSQKSKVKSQKSEYELRICPLYPDLMDTYGDKGNITAIVKRCQWRGIDVKVTPITIDKGQLTIDNFDFFFFGGGQDKAQVIVGRDLKTKKLALVKSIKDGAVLLSICGGYQLLQKYFKTIDGKVIEGIGLFDAHTIGSNTRMIQNLLIKINPDLRSEINAIYQTTDTPALPAGRRQPTTNLVGFENHSGKTYLGKGVQPLGHVVKGSGNNGEDKTEGAVYKNAFGCYLHGSLLPTNPHFADYLIAKALERRYGKSASWRKLKPLNDSIEWLAHKSAIARTR